jgi:hypothetical protein
MFNTKTAVYAAAFAGGILSLICAFFVAIAPQATLKIGNLIAHGLDFTLIAQQNMTVGSVILGMFVVAIISAAIVGIFGYFYNKLSGR